MSGRAGARALVEQIQDQHGYVPQEVLARLSEADRQAVLKALRQKDNMIASSIMVYDPCHHIKSIP
jgi:hypothetical protein